MTDTQNKGAAQAAFIGLLLGPLVLLLCLVTSPPAGLSETAWLTVGLAGLMAVWWATEAIPIPATSLLPILLVPLLGIDTLNKATAPYANPTIFLFLGGFLLGLAMQRPMPTRRSFCSSAASCWAWPCSAGTCTNVSPWPRYWQSATHLAGRLRAS